MQFWRPGEEFRPDREEILAAGIQKPLLSDHQRVRVLYALEQGKNVIIQGDPGTQTSKVIASHLVAAGWSLDGRCVAVALPRQVAVISSVVHVAEDNSLDESHLGGDHVGFVLESSVKRSSTTKLVYFTNRSLLQTLLKEPLLGSVSVVIVDQFHERSIGADLLLALLKKVQRVRTDLCIIVITAEFTDRICSYLGKARTTQMFIAQRGFPVSIFYTKRPVEDYLQTAMKVIQDAFLQWIRAGQPDSTGVLMFVQGTEEAELFCSTINEWSKTNSEVLRSNGPKESDGSFRKKNGSAQQVLAVSLYSGLDVGQQLSVLSNAVNENCLKVVVSTNIAETTVTVPGISTVIDCGLERVEMFDPRMKTSFISTVQISATSARRRAARAGINQHGSCFRLYTHGHFKSAMAESRPPAVLRCELTEMVLILKAIGVVDVTSFDFLERPDGGLVIDALERLFFLGAISGTGSLTTETGVRICLSSANPRIGKCILVGESYGIGRVMAAVAALLEVRQVLFNTGRSSRSSRALFSVAEGDIITMLNVWRRYVNSSFSDSWCADHGINPAVMQKVRRSFARIVRTNLRLQSKDERFAAARKAIGLSLVECVCRSITAGYFENAAMVEPDGSYLVALPGRRVKIHRQSVLYKRMPKWVTYMDLSQSSTTCEMKDVTVIQPQWLTECARHLFETVTEKFQS